LGRVPRFDRAGQPALLSLPLGLLALLTVERDPDRREPTRLERALEHAADVALGLTALGWALRDLADGRFGSPVGAALVAVNAVVGLLLLWRRRAVERAGLGPALLCLASVASSGLVLGLAPEPAQWSLGPSLLFVAGAVGAIGSFVTLGACFGVLPAWRGLASHGPYRLVRHPAYAAELVMVAAAALAGGSWPALGAAALAVGLLVVRIEVEERLLGGRPEYRAYARRVRSRLLPGLW
jgi:protein-S-isoprenylcysteine O-methyltransferase Ste14